MGEKYTSQKKERGRKIEKEGGIDRKRRKVEGERESVMARQREKDGGGRR